MTYDDLISGPSFCRRIKSWFVGHGQRAYHGTETFSSQGGEFALCASSLPTVQCIYIKLHARVESPSATSEDPWLKAPVPLPDPWFVVGVWECYGIKGYHFG